MQKLYFHRIVNASYIPYSYASLIHYAEIQDVLLPIKEKTIMRRYKRLHLKEDLKLLQDSCQKVAVYMANQFCVGQEDFKDLFQLGTQVLNQAIEEYDLSSKEIFHNYLALRIHHVFHERLVRIHTEFTIPEEMKANIQLLRDAKKHLKSRGAKKKKSRLLVSIAKETKLPVALVKETLIYTLQPAAQENDGILFSTTPFNKNLLSPTERKSLELFYGAYGTKRNSIIEIADLKNLTERTVEIMINSGLMKLIVLL